MVVAKFTAISTNYRSAKYFCLTACLGLLVIGCENQTYSQCQEIIEIANKVSDRAKEVSTVSEEQLTAVKTWLKTADMMNLAALEIEAVPVQDPQLIAYQSNLANVFRVYSQSTYDAVEARESKSKSALQLASNRAKEIGKLNQNLIAKINSYCRTSDKSNFK